MSHRIAAVVLALYLFFALTPALAVHHAWPDENSMGLAEDLVSPAVVDGFLPVFCRSKTTEKVVAFTIDDCFQPDNLKKIVALFEKYGGKATLFPIGENIAKNSETLVDAWKSGFEIENHTWSHSGLYHEDDKGLVSEIWDQNRAVSELLGVDYQMHFLRPRGGDNRYDQRTHAYLRQLGYYGIAYWNKVGRQQTPDYICSNISSGDILLYHTTDEDLHDLEIVVPRLYKAGYRFITLNEMFCLPGNETYDLTPEAEREPLEPYERFDQMLKKDDYLHDVYLVQERLSILGYLTSNYNGYYGDKTIAAVRAFQKANGLEADGVVGHDTWEALFSAD